MKLGTETGSVMNHLMSRATVGQPAPEIGMGVTLLSWTDRNAGTIVDIVKKKTGDIDYILVTEDDAKLVGGSTMSEDQTYEYTTRQDGYRSIYKQLKSGAWTLHHRNPETGRLVKASQSLAIGYRETYRDPCF